MILKKLFVVQILTIALLAAVILVAQPAFAGLYKWVDDQGKVHFTDDKAKIPKKYRTDTQMKRLHSIASPKETPSTGSSSGSSKGDKGGGGMDAASFNLKDKEGILEEAEEKAVEEVIAFFESENARNAPYKDGQAIYVAFQELKASILKDLPPKKGLMEKFAESKEPALKETYEYLKKSAADDQSMVTLNMLEPRLMRLQYRRVVDEIKTKEALKEKLLAAVEKSNKKKEALKKAEEEKKQAEAEKEKTKATAKK